MGRIRRVTIDPDDPQSIIDQLNIIIEVLDGQVSFGTPQDPRDDQSSALPGASLVEPNTHPGTLANIEGSWCEGFWASSGTPYKLWHNLYRDEDPNDTTTVTEENVTWLIAGIRLDGTVFSPNSNIITVWRNTDDAISSNSIDLRCDSPGGSPDLSHPIRVWFFFIKGPGRAAYPT